MPRFDPHPGTTLEIANTCYTVMPHPAVPVLAFGQEGRKATIYQLANNGRLFAFKIFKQPYRFPRLVDTCQTLSQFKTLAGLEVCERICLTPALTPALLHDYPEMAYAVLMPWVVGTTWFDILQQKQALTQAMSRQLGQRLAQVLAGLEEERLAHCDIAGPNVIVNDAAGTVSLIDVEDMYGNDLVLHDAFPMGTAGYQHRSVRGAPMGQWHAAGDRFAGAVLLAEMLTWHQPAIRQAADAEHFFTDDELQNNQSPKYQVMVDALNEISRELAQLFTRSWTATTLADCPLLREWALCLGKETKAPSWFEQFIGKLDQSRHQMQHVPTINPQAPIGINEQFQVEWSAVAGAQMYELQEAMATAADQRPDESAFTTIYRGFQTHYLGLHGQANHYAYRVRSIDRSGNGGTWSQETLLQVTGAQRPRVTAYTGRQYASDQAQETQLRYVETAQLYLRYLSAHSSAHYMAQNDSGDYLAWVEHADDDALDFVICDGGSNASAAHFLGNRLLRFFRNAGPRLEKFTQETAALELLLGELQEWPRLAPAAITQETKALVASKQADEANGHGPLQGSAVAFLCGRLSYRPAASVRLIVAWMGATQLYLYDATGRQHALGGQWQPADHWSTTAGVVGQLHVQIVDLTAQQIERITAFSDGLQVDAAELYGLDDSTLRAKVMERYRSPTNDDISLIDIRIKPQAPNQLAAPTITWHGEGRYELVWSQIVGARRYEIEIADTGLFTNTTSYQTDTTSYQLADVPNEAYCYCRVRAQGAGASGPWSNVVGIEPLWTLAAPVVKVIPSWQNVLNKFTLSWSAVETALFYKVTQSIAQEKAVTIYVGEATEWTVADLAPGLYQYRVHAYGKYGEESVSALTAPHEVPPRLQPLRLDQIKEQLLLSWQTGQFQQQDFELIKGTNPFDAEIIAVGSAVEWRDKVDVDQPTTYYYGIRRKGSNLWQGYQSFAVTPQQRSNRNHSISDQPHTRLTLAVLMVQLFIEAVVTQHLPAAVRRLRHLALALVIRLEQYPSLADKKFLQQIEDFLRDKE